MARAGHDIVLRARIQPDVDVRVAGIKISNLGTKTYELKDRQIQAAAEINHTPIAGE